MGRIGVRVQPRASRDEVVGLRGVAVVVRVSAPPVDGRANDAVRKLLAKRLGVRPGSVAVVHGAGARDKLVEVDGLGDDELLERLAR